MKTSKKKLAILTITELQKNQLSDNLTITSLLKQLDIPIADYYKIKAYALGEKDSQYLKNRKVKPELIIDTLGKLGFKVEFKQEYEVSRI